MHVQHVEKGIYYSDKQLLLIARKIGKLATYCERLKDSASLIRVETQRSDTKKNRDQVRVIVNITLPHKLLHAQSLKNDPVEALDRCVEKLERQVEKYRGQHMSKRLGKGSHRRSEAAA